MSEISTNTVQWLLNNIPDHFCIRLFILFTVRSLYSVFKVLPVHFSLSKTKRIPLAVFNVMESNQTAANSCYRRNLFLWISMKWIYVLQFRSVLRFPNMVMNGYGWVILASLCFSLCSCIQRVLRNLYGSWLKP